MSPCPPLIIIRVCPLLINPHVRGRLFREDSGKTLQGIPWPIGGLINPMLALLCIICIHIYIYIYNVSHATWVWINTYRYIFSGMNIHLPAILGFTRYQGFDPSPHVQLYIYQTVRIWWNLSDCRAWIPAGSPWLAPSEGVNIRRLSERALSKKGKRGSWTFPRFDVMFWKSVFHSN